MIGLTGPPRSGKTTIAKRIAIEKGLRVLHTDDFQSVPWSGVPAAILEHLELEAYDIIEGVQVPRAIRKGVEVEKLFVIVTSVEVLSKGQASMAKGLRTILEDVEAMGVDVEEFATWRGIETALSRWFS